MEPSPANPIRARGFLRRLPDVHFVDSDEFLALLVSPRSMDRSDDRDAAVLGLCDRATGQRYLIEEERIPSPAPSHPHPVPDPRDAAS